MFAKRRLTFILLCLLISVHQSVAEEVDKEQPLKINGDFEIDTTQMSRFPLDMQGTQNRTSLFQTARLGLDIEGNLGHIQWVLDGELQLLRVQGATETAGTSLSPGFFVQPKDTESKHFRFLLRDAYFEKRTSVGLFRVGAQTMHWGLGMLVNNQEQSSDFGDHNQVSSAIRALWATKPFPMVQPLSLMIAFDQIIRDDNAEWDRGDDAIGASIAIRYLGTKLRTGFLTSIRHQKDRMEIDDPIGKRTIVKSLIADYFWHLGAQEGEDGFRWSGEIAGIWGSTDRLFSEENFNRRSQVASYGAVTRLVHTTSGLDTGLEAAYASGDRDIFDGTIRRFRFSTNYGSGLILVDHILPLLSARAVDRIDDPELIDVPPPRLRFALHQGGLESTAYLKPSLSYRLSSALRVDLAYFEYIATAPLVDLYQTGLNGGYSTGFNGQSNPNPRMGREIDAQVNITVPHYLTSKLIDAQVVLVFGAFQAEGQLSSVLQERVYLGQINLKASW